MNTYIRLYLSILVFSLSALGLTSCSEEPTSPAKPKTPEDTAVNDPNQLTIDGEVIAWESISKADYKYRVLQRNGVEYATSVLTVNDLRDGKKLFVEFSFDKNEPGTYQAGGAKDARAFVIIGSGDDEERYSTPSGDGFSFTVPSIGEVGETVNATFSGKLTDGSASKTVTITNGKLELTRSE